MCNEPRLHPDRHNTGHAPSHDRGQDSTVDRISHAMPFDLTPDPKPPLTFEEAKALLAKWDKEYKDAKVLMDLCRRMAEFATQRPREGRLTSYRAFTEPLKALLDKQTPGT